MQINWDLNNTDMSFYNDLLRRPRYYEREKGITGKIVYITSEEYMLMSANIHGSSVSREPDFLVSGLVEKYAEDMKIGDKFPIPVIDLSVRN